MLNNYSKIISVFNWKFKDILILSDKINII